MRATLHQRPLCASDERMKSIRLLVAALSLVTSFAFAAPPPAYVVIDNSASILMDQPTAESLWKGQTSAKFQRLYPMKRWGFVSEVEGGFDDAKNCVVTARAMMLPRSGKALLYRPAKTATAFGIHEGATQQQCRAFANAKLKEAINAVGSALIAQ